MSEINVTTIKNENADYGPNLVGYSTVTGGLRVTSDITGNLVGNVTGDVTGNLTGDVTGNLTGDVTGNVTGIATFATTAGIATYTSEWSLESGDGSDYGISGPGLTGTENDPTFYLTRGEKYKFTNNTGGHPFRIQSTPNGSVGTQYNDGITNNDAGNGTTLLWDVQFDSPDILYYQCTTGGHGGMGGKIYIVNAGIASDVSVNTTGIITATEFSGGGSGLTGVDATTLDSIDSGSFLRSDADDSFSGSLTGSTGSRISFGNVDTAFDTAGEIPTSGTHLINGADNGTSTATPANINLYSWYGVGFGPSITGQAVTKGELSHLFNARNGDATFVGSLTCVNVNSTSDINLKKDIEVITDATDLIKQLNGVKFTWKKNDEKSVGVIAQEVENVLPELISEKQDTGEKSVNYSGLIAVLIESVKELSARVEKLENR